MTKRIILAVMVGVLVSGLVWGEAVKFEDLVERNNLLVKLPLPNQLRTLVNLCTGHTLYQVVKVILTRS